MTVTIATAGRMKHKPASPARARKADVDRHLGRVGTRDEIGGADEVEELVARHPLPTTHHFIFHHREVRRGTAKGRAAEAKEQPC